MNDSKYRYILYVIIIVIISTIGIQAYWNYKNYRSSKQQVINDIQASLDKAVDDYYANLAENSTIGFTIKNMSQKDFLSTESLDSILESIETSNTHGFGTLDSISPNLIEGISIVKGVKGDSTLKHIHVDKRFEFKSDSTTQLKTIIIDSFSKPPNKEALIGYSEKDLKFLTSKVIISMTTDSLSLQGIDTLLQSEFRRKDIAITYTIKYQDPTNTTAYYDSNKKHITIIDSTAYGKHITTLSKSAFLPNNSELILLFNDVSNDIFKRIIWGILISILLVLAVISCLFYLLKIIKHQKQLAEVKNDLISNITHEFKTPIATIGVALESIQNFNAIENKDKTKTYLEMSREQLSKLNTMVEKLLETATLDTENLELNSERYHISEVITNSVVNFKLHHPTKEISYSIEPEVYAHVDVFHFENAINNIIDNACKYGGNTIHVDLKSNSSQIEIVISDNGHSLTPANKERVFEKFYRIPKGNTHDIKGFGIGLYYTKKIIEKHNGSIQLNLGHKFTSFKIKLPNV